MLFCVDSSDLARLDAPLIEKTLTDISKSYPNVKKFGILCMKCDKPGAASVSTIQQELLTKADKLKSIATASGIDLRIFAVSSSDNLPFERLKVLTKEVNNKIKEFKAANDTDGLNKAEKEKWALQSCVNVEACITWGTGQLDVVKWIVTGDAPAGSSLLTDSNQSNPLV